MNLLADAASDQTSWPDVIVYLALFAFMGFVFWLMSRD